MRTRALPRAFRGEGSTSVSGLVVSTIAFIVRPSTSTSIIGSAG